jgi:hypothetical protein
MKSFLFISLAMLIIGCKSTPNDFSSVDVDHHLSDAPHSLGQAAAAPTVDVVSELGTVSEPPTVLTRDGGETALIGGKILWTFGDKIFNPQSVDGDNLRSNTAALANPSLPLTVTEPTDANGAPYQALPFTPAEQAYNDSTNNANDRIALWIGGLVPDRNGSALCFYLKLFVKGSLNFPPIGVGAAHFALGSTIGVRDPGLIFTSSEPQFVRAMSFDGKVYLYGHLNNGDPALPFGVARAALAKATKRSAYRFWNGSEWSSNIGATAKVFNRIPGQLSVSYNGYLQRFIAVHSGVFSNKIFMRTACRPEGPWSAPQELYTGLPPAMGSVDYAGQEHPELAKNHGKTIYVSYYRPTGFLQGELRLVEITFK